MSMTPAGRRDAIFNAIMAANPKTAEMQQGDQDKLKGQLLTVFGGDLSYWLSFAEIQGSQYQAPATSCTVATATGPASGTTSPASIVGTGKIT